MEERRSGRRLCLFLTTALFCVMNATGSPVTQSYGVFDVTFYNAGDGDGYATGQQDWTAQQMADVAASLAVWQGNIGNTAGRQVQMHVFWNEPDSYGTNVLGGSASYRVGDGTTIWNLGEYVWKENENFGTSSYGFDTVIQYDVTAAGLGWNFGSTAPTSGQIDFRSVITHEIGHSLGFDTSYDKDYDDWGWFYTGSGGQGDYYGLTAWEKNLVDSAGNRALSGGTGTPGNFNELDNPVYFDGANAVALYGGDVPIYAPAVYSAGSSLCHLDEAVLGGLLMSPFVANGQMIRTVSDLEWAIMKDMGWNIIPEPASILLFGIAAFCYNAKRCKKS